MKKKLPRYNKGKSVSNTKLVFGSMGWHPGEQGSWIGQDEPVTDDKWFGDVPHMAGGKSGKNENIPSSIKPNDSTTVYATNDGDDPSGLSFADEARPHVKILHEKNKPVLKTLDL